MMDMRSNTFFVPMGAGGELVNQAHHINDGTGDKFYA
jgi:hypothetical protein